MNSWWGCATQFSKSCPYFKPKNVIFHIGFQTSLKSIPIFRPGLIQPVPGSQIVGERLRSFLLFYFHVCAFSIQQTQLSWSLEQARPDQAEIMSSLSDQSVNENMNSSNAFRMHTFLYFILIHLELKRYMYTPVVSSKTIPDSRPKFGKCFETKKAQKSYPLRRHYMYKKRLACIAYQAFHL